jgi:ABC-type dipeptide/oligopeptide/nickel transport system permease component
MLRYALRRLIWLIPTFIGISLVSYLLLSFIPDPTDAPGFAASLPRGELERLRRERFVDLPRFINTAPQGVRVRARAAMNAIAAGGPGAAAARIELARLGGAALPHVLPLLDALAPEPRAQVALALAPVARRMGIDRPELDDSSRVVAFWVQLWSDRSVEYRTATVRSAVKRVMRYGSTSRARDLIELDTFALPEIIAALEPPQNEVGIERVRVLIELAAHATTHDDRISTDSDLESARAAVERWQRYWTTYGSDFVAFTGASRLAQLITETRYGKWALDAVTHGFGVNMAGTNVKTELTRRAPITLTLCLGAIALAYVLSILLGVVSAVHRKNHWGFAIGWGVLGLFATPVAVVAVLVIGIRPAPELIVAIVLLAAGLMAAPTHQVRSALIAALSGDVVRAAIARGASPMGAAVSHGLRGALATVVTLAALETPLALGGAFVLEYVFKLKGLGEATVRAVETRDISWLMAISLILATIAAIGVMVTDLVHAAVDPRVGPALLLRRRR